MDMLDKKLLTALQQDASQTNAKIAEDVGLSPSSCLRRIRRLKRAGYISRTVAVVNAAKVGRPIKAVVTVELDDHGLYGLGRFLEEASNEVAVQQAFSVTGEVDAVLIMRLADMDEFHEVSTRLFRENERVLKFRTMIAVNQVKDETAVAL